MVVASKRPRRGLVARFWSQADRRGPDECWLWRGFTHKGYGRFNAEAALGTKRAHRVAYLLERGPIPPDRALDHICRNKACVNPSHLGVVTQRENLRRGAGPGGALDPKWRGQMSLGL